MEKIFSFNNFRNSSLLAPIKFNSCPRMQKFCRWNIFFVIFTEVVLRPNDQLLKAIFRSGDNVNYKSKYDLFCGSSRILSSSALLRDMLLVSMTIQQKKKKTIKISFFFLITVLYSKYINTI